MESFCLESAYVCKLPNRIDSTFQRQGVSQQARNIQKSLYFGFRIAHLQFIDVNIIQIVLVPLDNWEGHTFRCVNWIVFEVGDDL